MTLIRERPPLQLELSVQTPDGQNARWGPDERHSPRSHSGLDFTTTIPGGFEHLDVTLERDPRYSYPDIAELSAVVARGVGAMTAWEGRVETTPSVSGDQMQITPAAVGWQSHLTDDNSVQELFVEIDMTQWQAPSLARQLAVLGVDIDIDTASFTGSSLGLPCIDTGFSGSWPRSHTSELWYDAKGAVLGQLIFNWQVLPSGLIGDIDPTTNGSLAWAALLSDDDVETSTDSSANQKAHGPGSGTVTATTNTRTQAAVYLYYDGAGGSDGVSYDVYWTALTLVGNQGLPLYAADDAILDAMGDVLSPATMGVLGSDVLNYAIPKYAPLLRVARAGQSTITPSTFVIPELVFPTPVFVNDILTQVTSFELQDWAIWEDRTFWWYPRNSLGRRWRTRVGPSKLQQAGPQISRLYNGVCCSFSDYLGVTRTVGPPGSGAQYISPGPYGLTAQLQDTSADNAVNSLLLPNGQPLRRWALVQLQTSTPQAAAQVGQVFLEQQAIVNQAGQATLTGYVEDDHGVLWPAYMVRAGDQIAFMDAADPSYRRIVSTDYSDAQKTNSIQLDVPPDTMQALLDRLNVVLTSVGVG